MFKIVNMRHSRFCSSQFSPSQASGSGGGSTQMAVPFVTMQTNPSEHSSSPQSRGVGTTRIGLQRTTGSNPALSRTRHSIPSSHSTFSQLVGGGWGTHLARGPRRVCRTSHTGLSVGHRITAQLVGGCDGGGRTHCGEIYCLQFGRFLGQVGGTTLFTHIRRAGHRVWAQVGAAQRLVTSLPFDERKNVALHSPWQASTLHSLLRKRRHRVPLQGLASQTTGCGHVAF